MKPLKSILSILFALLLISSCTQPGSVEHPITLTEATAREAGMSEARLLRIDAMLNQAIADEQIPGAVALVARHGKIVYHKAFGLADVEADRSFQPDDIFRIASQTKAITSTAVMMLWEEGKFRLDDPIAKFIPEFEHMQIFESLNEADSSFAGRPATKPITIRHLLTHTSGIGYGDIDDDNFRLMYQKAGILIAFATEDVSIEENIKKLAGLPLHFEPGEQFKYAMGLDVLGYLIEILSGQPLDQFFNERIFEPLGMNDTYFYLPESKYDRLVPVQTKQNGEWVKYPASAFYDPEYPVKGAKRLFSGGGGLSSTPRDYALFLQMYLNNGELNGVRLLSRTTIKTIMSNQIGDLSGGSDTYHGLAFGVVDKGGVTRGGLGSAGTFTWGGYFNTQYFADPDEQVIGILMKQTEEISGDETGWKFRQLVFQAIDD